MIPSSPDPDTQLYNKLQALGLNVAFRSLDQTTEKKVAADLNLHKHFFYFLLAKLRSIASESQMLHKLVSDRQEGYQATVFFILLSILCQSSS
jgi:hypothetical protein